MLVYERNFGGASIGKAKDRLLPWEKNLALEYISEYRNFVPSPRGTFGENKVPMIRLMELSAQRYSGAFRSKAPARGIRKDASLASEANRDISIIAEKVGMESKEKSEPYSFYFSNSPSRPKASIMLRSMGEEYDTQRPRFEPNRTFEDKPNSTLVEDARLEENGSKRQGKKHTISVAFFAKSNENTLM